MEYKPPQDSETDGEPPATWELDEPLRPVPFDDPVREVVITLEDVEPMEVVDIKEVPAPAYSVGKVGRPRELFRAKHLRLSDDAPMAKNRGIVEITDGPGFEAKTLEAVLVDFETGEVARFANAYGTHRGLGVAWGKQLADGVPQSVLIHSDGLAVPWVAEGTYRLLTDVVVNVGRREIFLFQKNERWSENRRGTTYARWTDLRKPPPKPTLSIPVPPESFDHEGTFGRYGSDLLGVNRNVTASNDNISRSGACGRVEFLPDGTWRCIPRSDIILGDGWHLTHTNVSWVAYNEAKKEIQYLGFGCRVWDFSYAPRSVSPPRIDFECGDNDAMIVWSPERTVILRNDTDGMSNPLRRHTAGVMGWWDTSVKQDDPAALGVGAFADFSTLRQQRTECVLLSSYSQHPRNIMLHRCGSQDLYLYNADRAEMMPVADGDGCSTLLHWEAAEDLWVYKCETRGGRTKWVEAVDVVAKRKWRLSKLRTARGGRFRWIWVQPDPRMLVVVDETGSADRLLAWDLR